MAVVRSSEPRAVEGASRYALAGGDPALPPELPRCAEDVARFVVPGRSVVVADGGTGVAPA